MKKMVIDGTKLKSKPKFQFRWNEQDKEVKTKFIARSIKSTTEEKETLKDLKHSHSNKIYLKTFVFIFKFMSLSENKSKIISEYLL